MAVIRTEKKDNYTVVSNSMIRDYILKNYYNAHAREELSTGGAKNEQV